MSQIVIISGVLGLISLLVCYVFIRQTVIKKQREKARLQRALSKRAGFLTQMVSSFPENFLTRELSVLLYRCIVDVYEQLSQLVPDDPQHLDNFKLYNQRMEEALKNSNSTNNDPLLENSSHINEVRQYLNHLGRFIQNWTQRGNITQKQHGVYKEQLKKLGAKLMVDNYIISAQQAAEIEKIKLAIHYYLLAKNLILDEGLAGDKGQQLRTIEEKIPRLQEQLEGEIHNRVGEHLQEEQTEPPLEDDQSEWSGFKEDDADWKKKNVYD